MNISTFCRNTSRVRMTIAKAVAWAALGGATVAVLSGCSKPAAPVAGPVEVTILKVEPRDTPIIYEFIATTQSPQAWHTSLIDTRPMSHRPMRAPREAAQTPDQPRSTK